MKPLNMFNWGFAFILAMVFLSYGAFWSRGGYSDDFPFLSYATSAGTGYLEAMFNWPFNSRYSQGAFVTLLLKIFTDDITGAINWAGFQFFGLIIFSLTLVLFNAILVVFEMPWRFRLIAILFFALYPIKNQALLWPTTIVTYVLALFFLLLGTWLYLSLAKRNQETPISLIAIWFIFLVAAFFIEQIMPTIPLIVVLRLWFYQSSKKQIIIHVGGVGVLLAIFFWAYLFTEAVAKFDRYSSGNKSILEGITQIIYKPIFSFFTYTPRYLLDDYYWPQLFNSFISFSFWLSLLISSFFWLLLSYNRSNEFSSDASTGQIMGAVGIAGLFWFACFSPFILIEYGMPVRTYYIPLLSMSIVIAALVFFALQSRHKWIRILFTSLGWLGTAIFVFLNLYAQDNFSQQWRKQSILIDAVEQIQNEIPRTGTVHLPNFPRNFGPAPDLDDYWTFQGILNWLYPDLNLRGDMLSHFSRIVPINSKLIPSNEDPVAVKIPSDRVLLLWSDRHQSVEHIQTLLLQYTSSGREYPINEPHLSENSDVNVHLVDISQINLSEEFPSGYSLQMEYMFLLKQLDIAGFHIKVRANDADQSPGRLIAHANYKGPIIIPYGHKVLTKYGRWSKDGLEYSTDLLISNYSELIDLEVGLLGERTKLKWKK